MEHHTIILIGPPCVGKSTQSTLISGFVGRKTISVDILGRKYCEEYGFYKINFMHIEKTSGYLAAYQAWEEFRVISIERVLNDYPGHVIDFGAGHSHYIIKSHLITVSSLLRPYENIFLLMPSENKQSSVDILRKRSLKLRNKTWIWDGYDYLHHCINDEDNYMLAKNLIVTSGKSIIQCRNEIISKLKS